MRIPFKYDKWPIIVCFSLMFFLLGATLLNSIYLSGEINPVKIFLTALGIALNTLLGWVVAIKFTGTILTRKVDHPLDPHKLFQGQTYWLNGKNECRYLGQMEHTGRYLFHIERYHRKDRPLDSEAIPAIIVQEYLSDTKEI